MAKPRPVPEPPVRSMRFLVVVALLTTALLVWPALSFADGDWLNGALLLFWLPLVAQNWRRVWRRRVSAEASSS